MVYIARPCFKKNKKKRKNQTNSGNSGGREERRRKKREVGKHTCPVAVEGVDVGVTKLHCTHV